jgi:signal transduction histidine kinase
MPNPLQSFIPSMGRHPQIVVVTLVAIIAVGFIGGARHYAEKARLQAAYDTAKSFEDSIIALHQYYSKVIVPRARAIGAEFAIDFEKYPHKFPFPATVSSKFGDALRSINPSLSTSLYSLAPFPNVKGRLLDQFEKESLDYLQANPTSDYFRIENINGKEFVRYARAMTMKQDCVDCHNRPEFGFEGRWKVGDFRGARQVSLPVPELAPIIDQATYSAVILAIVSAVLGGFMIWPVVGNLHRNLLHTQELARDLEISNSELGVANAELKEANRVKTTFFSIIAHDLRSPFTTRPGMTRLMVHENNKMDKDDLVEFANHVNDEGNRVFNLLQNLLEWSQVQMSGATYDPHIVNLNELTQESIEILNPVAREKAISIENQIGETTAYADKNMIMMVIRNLIGNALKFTPTGGSITISSHPRDNEIQLSVIDTGIGMTADDVALLFDGQYGVSKIGTAGEQGSGLGLQLCKEMVEKNGGTIWAESKLKEGAQFHFTLPTGPNADPAPVQNTPS